MSACSFISLPEWPFTQENLRSKLCCLMRNRSYLKRVTKEEGLL